MAKDLLGEEVCIVLGGRHVTESMYQQAGGGTVCHHPSSPLRLMAEGSIPPVFDIVVSGDGEEVIVALGEIVARLVANHRPAAEARYHLEGLTTAAGSWIVGACLERHIRTVVSRGTPLYYDHLPAPCAMFGVRTCFDVFGGLPTAHVYSDVGRGCIYDCNFCSERHGVTGQLRQLEGSPDRLVNQLSSAVRVIEEDYPGVGASAFVEDSTLLAFAPKLIQRFLERLADLRLAIRFGGQLTIDQILSRPAFLPLLRAAGFEYVFIGLETFSPAEVGGMSKDVRRDLGSWIDRAERVFALLRAQDIQCGVGLLFGLGEPHHHRLALIEQVRTWRARYGLPGLISLNWAVQHPLLGADGGTGYTYTRWAVPEGPFLEAFADFGEASVHYSAGRASAAHPS
jgi:B12-binding domain/radical SAM domain protein